ncbi:MAG TPA: HAMP domain-containing protein [Candidatus Dormibacteraeota bacterium]|nr:HAMP domain-containing protein [Candidatus Dormibacteraeota bacterium]
MDQRIPLAGVRGGWAGAVHSVNDLVEDLVRPTSETARVITAVAGGDLSQTVPLEVDGVALKGQFAHTARTVNTMVTQLSSFSSEVTRVAREVGTEGKLGGQARVGGVGGVWKDLTDSVNTMAGNLTAQVRNIAEVTTAVARGDLSKKITVEGQGEILELKSTVNVMVDQLNAFASEVTRVAREVGTEGKLGGQAQVQGVGGVWKELTDNVNLLAGQLTSQIRNIAEVTTAVASGDLSKKVTVDVQGEILELKNTINVTVDRLNAFAWEVTRVAHEVGTEGKLGGQAHVRGVAGVWKELTDNVNLLAGQLTSQIRNIAEVTTAVANGDLSKKVTVDVRGEFLELKNTINVMVDQLNAFAWEVTRVAHEVGTEGKLGGRANVPGISGVWKDLTDNVNSMADNLTDQVRGIAQVVTAVANGDLRRKLVVVAKGEVAALADTINEMTDTLGTFADQVTTVARQVGVEGRLGGQAHVPGAAGTWKDLTDNVNQLAATLTDQIRAIADVATAVTEGDLTRSIGVRASGEVAVLKDNINEMIRNLRETTLQNTEQDWLKTYLTHFTRLLQGQRDRMSASRLILSELAPLVNAQHGVIYTMDTSDPQEPVLRYQAGYAHRERDGAATVFRVGEGLVGQCAHERERILLLNVPGDYIAISSGLGEAPPLSIVVLPIVFEDQVLAVIELASFQRFSAIHLDFLDQLTKSIAIVLNTIEATMRTEELLEHSQSMADELREQQEELRHTNEELEEKARLLADRNTEVERKNDQVEQARHALEEKAEQLALTSRYKSEFLANMSHELRTPLNSMFILAHELAENPEGNLSSRQVEYANIILGSGQDLLNLINDILDLTKIESGKVALDIGEETFEDLREHLERSFRHVADARGVEFTLRLDPDLPAVTRTDPKRLQQVLKNLLANAFKFTERGRVELRVRVASQGWDPDLKSLAEARQVVAYEVADTGIGIPPDKQKTIFEAFQQVDGTTSRKYGGTGLGLSISRELVRLLGGEIRLQSVVGEGSTFTVYLPVDHEPAAAVPSGSTDAGAAGAGQTSPAPLSVTDDRELLGPGDSVVLIVDDDVNFCRVLLDLAHRGGFKGIVAVGGNEALALARRYHPTAITLDIGLRDISGWRVLEALRRVPATASIPVYVVTVFEDAEERAGQYGVIAFLAKPASREDLEDLFGRLRSSAPNGAGHGPVVDTEPRRRTQAQDAVNPRRVVPPDAAPVEPPPGSTDASALAGRTILVVDDDVRNLFALTATLERHGVRVIPAESGQEAMAALEGAGGMIDAVLLDIMMPDVDGYETLRRIRARPGFEKLPVIALTAKAMRGDRERCLRAGASDYISKPVDFERLLDLLRTWLTAS